MMGSWWLGSIFAENQQKVASVPRIGDDLRNSVLGGECYSARLIIISIYNWEELHG